MNNKLFKFLVIALAVAVVVPQIALAVWWNPFSWGIWNRVFHFKQTEQKQEKLIGGDKDAHGCLIAAGYSWCEPKKKCLRTWEEKCEADPTAGWKTYTNSQYGFEIKYPQDWKTQDYGLNVKLSLEFLPTVRPTESNNYLNMGKGFVLNIREINFNGYINALNNTSGPTYGVCGDPVVQKVEDFRIGFLQGKKITTCHVPIAIDTGDKEEHIFLEKNGLGYILVNANYKDSDNVKIFEKAVSSFKFTK